MMTDWYFAGMFEETFWAETRHKKFSNSNAAALFRHMVVEACEADATWLSNIGLLDTICGMDLAFVIRRKGDRVHWVLNPFRDHPEASGNAGTIGEAIDALSEAAQGCHIAR